MKVIQCVVINKMFCEIEFTNCLPLQKELKKKDIQCQKLFLQIKKQRKVANFVLIIQSWDVLRYCLFPCGRLMTLSFAIRIEVISGTSFTFCSKTTSATQDGL